MNKTFSSSVGLATYKVLKSHVWLVLPYWIEPTENISIIVERSIGQCCAKLCASYFVSADIDYGMSY